MSGHGGEGKGQLTIHLVEIRHLVDIAEVDGGEVLDSLGYSIEDFVLSHAVGIVVAAEPDHDDAVFFCSLVS